MGWFSSVLDGIQTAVDWVGDTFGGGSKNTKLSNQNAQLQATVESQKALMATYEGSIAQLTSQVNSLVELQNKKSDISKYLPYLIGGGLLIGGIYLMKGRGF